MTRDEAIVLREKQLCGHAVPPLMLAEAIELIKRQPERGKGGRPKGSKDVKPRPSRRKAAA